MHKLFSLISKLFKPASKKVSNVINRSYDEEYEGWLGV